MCKYDEEESAEDVSFHDIEGTGWVMCSSCIELLEEWKRPRDLWVLVSDEIEGEAKERVRNAYEEFFDSLSDIVHEHPEQTKNAQNN